MNTNTSGPTTERPRTSTPACSARRRTR